MLRHLDGDELADGEDADLAVVLVGTAWTARKMGLKRSHSQPEGADSSWNGAGSLVPMATHLLGQQHIRVSILWAA